MSSSPRSTCSSMSEPSSSSSTFSSRISIPSGNCNLPKPTDSPLPSKPHALTSKSSPNSSPRSPPCLPSVSTPASSTPSLPPWLFAQSKPTDVSSVLMSLNESKEDDKKSTTDTDANEKNTELISNLLKSISKTNEKDSPQEKRDEQDTSILSGLMTLSSEMRTEEGDQCNVEGKASAPQAHDETPDNQSALESLTALLGNSGTEDKMGSTLLDVLKESKVASGGSNSQSASDILEALLGPHASESDAKPVKETEENAPRKMDFTKLSELAALSSEVGEERKHLTAQALYQEQMRAMALRQRRVQAYQRLSIYIEAKKREIQAIQRLKAQILSQMQVVTSMPNLDKRMLIKEKTQTDGDVQKRKFQEISQDGIPKDDGDNQAKKEPPRRGRKKKIKPPLDPNDPLAKRGKKICKVPGCTNWYRKHGVCTRHGGRDRCSEIGCIRQAVKGGACVRHGRLRKCSVLGCDSQPVRKGVCAKHGGRNKCEFDRCESIAVKGGVCVKHGAHEATLEGVQQHQSNPVHSL